MNPVTEQEMSDFFERIRETFVANSQTILGISSRLEAVEAELSAYKNANAELQSRVQDLTTANANLSNDVGYFRSRNEDLQAQYNTEHDLRIASQRETADYVEMVAKAERERDEHKNTAHEAEVSRDNAAYERDNAVAQMEALRNLIAARDNLVAERDSEIARLKDMLASVSSQNETLHSENIALEGRLHEAETERDSYKGKWETVRSMFASPEPSVQEWKPQVVAG